MQADSSTKSSSQITADKKSKKKSTSNSRHSGKNYDLSIHVLKHSSIPASKTSTLAIRNFSISAGNVTKDFAATAAVLESAGIKFPSTSGSGVTLRSQRMKLPPSVGQKKTKAIEQMLAEIDVEIAPIPTEVR